MSGPTFGALGKNSPGSRVVLPIPVLARLARQHFIVLVLPKFQFSRTYPLNAAVNAPTTAVNEGSNSDILRQQIVGIAGVTRS